MGTFLDVATLAEEMAGTGSRLTKRARIAESVAAVRAKGAGDEGLFCLYLAGLPFAEADPRKLNAGGALLTKAVLAVAEATQAELTVAFRRHGDLGAAAHDLLVEHGKTGPGSSLGEVAEAFAAMAGAKTTAIRAAVVDGLLRKSSPVEAKYLLKLMLGDMRIGVKQSLVEEGIAVAGGADVAAVRHAVMLEADLGHAAQRAFDSTLGEAKMTLFHPLGFMLASPVETPEEAIERFTAKPVKVVAAKKPKRRKKADAVMEEVMTADVEAAMLEEEAARDTVDETSVIMGNNVGGEPIVEESTPPFPMKPERMGHPNAGVEAGAAVEAYLEDKYDGMRAQLHFGAADQPGQVAVYSRNREDITESFPELVEAFSGCEEALILDGEILGWDYSTGQALPFAVLGQRIGRKRVDNEIRQRIPVVFMAFDVMFADGELQLARPLRERRNRLEAAVEALVDTARSPLLLSEAAEHRKRAQAVMFAEDADHEGLPRLMISPARLVDSAEEIDRAYADARARANEGVMLKAAGSAYLPGRRGLAWVKLKRTLETLDVVITGAEYGSGRKSQFLSDYTFAVRDEDGELKNVGKAYSGVTDAEIAELTEFLKAHTLEDHGHFRKVEPLVILEVAFNNVMRSDRHASGFALRFPRILRIRTDKPLAEIDTVARVEEVYQSQVDKPAEQAGAEE